MKDKAEHAAAGSLRRKAAALWLLSGVLLAVVVGCIWLYRNPWIVHRMNAAQASAEVLEEIAESRSPYIKIDGMNLTFTGYYKVSDDGKICSYCYMGAVGEAYVLADLPVNDDGRLAESGNTDDMMLDNYLLCGQLVLDGNMTERLAEAENMDTEAYKSYYHIVNVEIHDFGSDQERLRIYQVMLLVLAAGLLAGGCILLSEARIAEKETQDKNI